MSARHTPGPWQFYADLPSAEPNWHIVTNASRMRVLANVHIEPGNEADIANARLIAAAPALLAAAESMLDWARRYAEPCLSGMGERYDVLKRDMEQAGAAIAKARSSS